MRVWVASFIFYVCVFLKCEILRFIVSRFVKPKNLYFAELLNEVRCLILTNNYTYKKKVFQFIGTVQICAPMYVH